MVSAADKGYVAVALGLNVLAIIWLPTVEYLCCGVPRPQ